MTTPGGVPQLHAEYDPKTGMILYKDNTGRVFERAKATAEEKRDAAKGLIPTVKGKAKPQPPKPAADPNKNDPPPSNLGQYAGLWNNPGAITPVAVDPATGDEYHRNPYTGETTVVHPGDRQRQAAVDASKKADRQQRDQASSAKALSQANQDHGYVWVNGQLQQMVWDPKSKAYVVNYVGGGLATTDKNGKVTRDPTRPDVVNTAFGALDGLMPSYLTGSEQFNLSTGPANIFTGTTNAGDGFGNAGTSYTPAGVGLTPAAAQHSQSANTVSNAKNQMTVAQGVQFFLNMSVQHPEQYKQLVDQLVAAHYVSPGLGQSAGGGYSGDAAVGFARAAHDLAQINLTPGGASLSLPDFLQQKADAAKAAAQNQVQPVNRAYQDPATLKYAARNAAQNVLGRDLTPAEEKAFESQFRGKENGYYDQVDASNRAQAGAQVMNTTAPGMAGAQPDTTGQANDYVYGDQFTTQRQGYSMLEYLKAFQGLLSSGHL